MSPPADLADNLVVPANFISAIREAGYIGISSALAELIDNSIEAGATVVDIRIERDVQTAMPRISIEDNGRGMDLEELQHCLQFGGSSRFDSRASFGRFGMGLPAASLSQSAAVEVHSWQNRMAVGRVDLDVDAIMRGASTSPTLKAGEVGSSPSGCRVVWSHCDRIEYRRLGWLERLVHKELGRMFRRFIDNGTSLRINGKRVHAIDPLMLSVSAEGATPITAFEPLHIEMRGASGTYGVVTVTFSILPVAAWHHLDNAEKRRLGIVGNGGVTVLRAGREVAAGWLLMGGKRKENYDDWWRCSIEFGPELDEHFGITINKQGVRPTQMLRQALEPEIESIARLLNARVRRAFEEVKFEAAVQASCRIAGLADSELPLLESHGRSGGPLSYRLGAGQIDGDSMFTMLLQQGQLSVTLSEDHPAYSALIKPMLELGDVGAPLRTAFELFVLSIARTVAAVPDAEQRSQTILEDLGSVYASMLHRA
jgi:hypothetical protein